MIKLSSQNCFDKGFVLLEYIRVEPGFAYGLVERFALSMLI